MSSKGPLSAEFTALRVRVREDELALLVPNLRRLRRGLLVELEQCVGVTGAVIDRAGVLDVEVVAARLDVLDRDLPGLVVLLALTPPLLLGRELLDSKRLGLVVALRSWRVGVLVEPDRLRRYALVEEEEVRLDARVRVEDPLRETDDRVEVALFEELLLNTRIRVLMRSRRARLPARARPSRKPPYRRSVPRLVWVRKLVSGRTLSIWMSSMSSTPLSAYLVRRASRTARATPSSSAK
jgi:hypothetical protein